MANEKRLIDSYELLADARRNKPICACLADIVDIQNLINDQPTVDAVEVVRCCSCEKHDHDGATGYCNRWGKWTKMSDFCSYGERKENVKENRP